MGNMSEERNLESLICAIVHENEDLSVDIVKVRLES
jgi:hypothetical protein